MSCLNEQLSSCLCFIFVQCYMYDVLCSNSLLKFSCLASVDSALMLVAVARPLMFKLLICTLPRLSAACCLGCLSCSVRPVCPLFHFGLLLPSPTMHLQTHPPFPHLSKSWLAVAMTTPCCPALLLPALPACFACGTLPCPCPVPFGDWPSMRCLWLTVLWGNGVVHQNLGLLLTGTTTVRSASTRSRGKAYPWVMTLPSHRREC